MEEFLRDLIPDGPEKYLVLGIIIIYYSYPQIRQFWYDARLRIIELDATQRTLEILKLKYEIEILAREKNLPLPIWPNQLDSLLGTERGQAKVVTHFLGRRARFLLGAFGSLSAFLVRASTEAWGYDLWLSGSFLLGVVTFCLVAGVLAIAFGGASWLRCFLIGVAAPVLVWGSVTLLSSSSQEPGSGSVSLVWVFGVAMLLFTFRPIWDKIVMPWIEDRIYQGPRIEGFWQSEITFPDGEKNKHRMQLRRAGYRVTGRTTCYRGYSEGNVYDLAGSFKDMILTCTYQIDDPRRLERGSMVLMLVNDGATLRGHLTYYDDKASSIRSTNCEWTAEGFPGVGPPQNPAAPADQ